jgi:DNA polymerase-3 subunit beta
MNFISTEDFRTAFGIVKSAISTKSPKPVLLNVLLSKGTLTASDLDIQITTEVEYDGPPLLLPHASIASILSLASDGGITVEGKGNRCAIRSGGGSWSLPTTHPSEFPEWKRDDTRPFARIPSARFAAAINATVCATDEAINRFALGSVLVEARGGRIAFVASDGKRVASVEFEADGISGDSQVLLPRKAAMVMGSLASRSREDVCLEVGGSALVLNQGNTVVRAILASGTFPAWRSVFPQAASPRSRVLPGHLLTATLQAAVVTNEDSKAVKYAISSEGIRLSAISGKSGESAVECPLESFGVEASVNLDPKYIEDFARNAEPGVPLEIEAFDSESPVVLYSGAHKSLVMPISGS